MLATQLFDDLYQAARSRYGHSSSSMSMSEWVCQNTTYKRAPFSLAGYPFQKAILDDLHPDLCVIKCSQVGCTELEIRKFLGLLARHDGASGIYTMPTDDMRNRLYKTRIKPILDADEIFNPPSEIKPTRTTGLVQIKGSFGYIVGNKEEDATSIPADFLFHDEESISDETVLALYQSRLQNSEWKATQSFSTPTFAGINIARRYSLSDQREFMCRCPSCNHWQVPLFTPKFVRSPFEIENFTDLVPEQIVAADLGDCVVVCEKCSKPLDLGNPANREWVATFPGREAFRGYYVRPFSTERISPTYIFNQLAKYLTQNNPRGFHNTVLGEPYTAAGAQITRQDTEACCAMSTPAPPDIDPTAPVFLGIDVGFQCHLSLSTDTPEGLPHFILYDTCPIGHLETRVHELRQIYNIVQGCVDRFPFTPDADNLRDVTDKLVLPVQYRGTAPIAPVKDELGNLTHYSVNQSLIFDRMHALIAHHKMPIGGYGTQKETLIAHLTAMLRDEQQEVETKWRKTTGVDHFFHSMALNLIARRVAEHMLTLGSSEVATTSILLGADWFPAKDDNPLIGQVGRRSRFQW